MINNEFRITGVTFNREVQIGFLFGLSFIIFWTLFLYLYYSINNLNELEQISTLIFLGAMLAALGISLYFLRLLGQKVRNDFVINVDKNQLGIYYQSQKVFFDYDKINEISLVGTSNNMRYFKIISENNKIKIRVGTYSLAPFSNKKDVSTMYSLMDLLVEILKKLNYKNKKVNTPNNVFENRILKINI